MCSLIKGRNQRKRIESNRVVAQKSPNQQERMLWGGLRPIRSRLALDISALVLSTYATNASKSTFNLPVLFENFSFLAVALLITLASAGLTKRWSISFPLILLVLLQSMQLILLYVDVQSSWIRSFIRLTSNSILVLSTILTILFPAVEISHPKGKFNIGIVDLHLPVKFDEEKAKTYSFDMTKSTDDATNTTDGYVSVRMFYPTMDAPESVPYFEEDTSKQICEALMTVGSPPPLNKLTWMLHTWQLSKIQVKKGAQPILHIIEEENDHESKQDTEKDLSKIPVVIYSHGVTGTASIYSYQAMSLAANGHVVFNVNHTDGSAIGMKKRDGSFLKFDRTVGAIERKSFVDHVRARRKQTDHRATELLALTEAIFKMNKSNPSDLEQAGISFVGRLDVENIIIAGHSFGGATAVTAASRNPSAYSCIIAHDPALDWMPDDARRAFFHESRFEGSSLVFTGGTGGYEVEESIHIDNDKKDDDCDPASATTTETSGPSIHDLNSFLLYSHEWKKLGYGGYYFVLDMFRRGQIGPGTNNLSECSFVHCAHHSEFSDSCMKTPLWLARAIGMTGKRNPHETSEEIGARTLDFLREVLKKAK